MSRYTLLLLLNLPFIIAGVVTTITQYKLGRMTRRRFISQASVWLIVLMGLIFAEPFYNWLILNDFTRTESLSLFDVVQITAIVVVFYLANKNRIKTERLERRLNDLHQELSIKLSQK